MTKSKIVRAWKDEAYRESLSDVERAMLPDHPAGIVELSDAELGFVAGGTDVTILEYGESFGMGTWGCCQSVVAGCGTNHIGGWSFGCCPAP